MGAFCVYGVTRELARTMAEKNIPLYDERGIRKFLTSGEYEAAIQVEANRLFDTLSVPTRISPEFDAPQFCAEFILLGEKAEFLRLAKIMCLYKKIDADGKAILNQKTGRPVMRWQPYSFGACNEHHLQ